MGKTAKYELNSKINVSTLAIQVSGGTDSAIIDLATPTAHSLAFFGNMTPLPTGEQRAKFKIQESSDGFTFTDVDEEDYNLGGLSFVDGAINIVGVEDVQFGYRGHKRFVRVNYDTEGTYAGTSNIIGIVGNLEVEGK